MITASHTTATVVQVDVPAPLHALEGVSSRYNQIIARIKIIFSSFYDRQVPLGYEDHSGFHYGEQLSHPTTASFENRLH